MAQGPTSSGADHESAHAFNTAAGNSVAVSAWTTVSRITGFVRVATIAAVLGPTFFGNIFLTTNLLPNYTFEFLTGNLVVSLLVPPLVRYIDSGQPHRTRRLGNAFLGLTLLVFGTVVLAVVVSGPLLLRLFEFGIEDAAVSEAQRRVGWILLAAQMPQVVLYGIAAVGMAVQHAHGRFALPTAASVVENLGVIVVLLTAGALFGTGTAVEHVTMTQVLWLGVGSTAAVALHAVLQWFGAWRVGVPLVPRFDFGDPDVRSVVRLAVPSLGYAILNSGRFFGMVVVASTVPGGVVAFNMAINFFNLPVAVGGRPLAWALMPHLARFHQQSALAAFHREMVRGLAVSLFVVVPAAAAYVFLAMPLAEAASFGAMATEQGTRLIAASLAALGLGVIGETMFVHGTHAHYARRDATVPLKAMAARVLITAGGLAVAFTRDDGVAVLATMGVAVTVADLCTGGALFLRLRRVLPSVSEGLLPALARATVATAVMAVPAIAITHFTSAQPAHAVQLVGIASAVAVGLAAYLGVQLAWRSPELYALVDALRPSTRMEAS